MKNRSGAAGGNQRLFELYIRCFPKNESPSFRCWSEFSQLEVQGRPRRSPNSAVNDRAVVIYYMEPGGTAAVLASMDSNWRRISRNAAAISLRIRLR
jgi:hypothetical protein